VFVISKYLYKKRLMSRKFVIRDARPNPAEKERRPAEAGRLVNQTVRLCATFSPPAS
jgi:hypothetical protein